MKQDRKTGGGRKDMHVTTEMDAERGHQPGKTAARHRLRSGVEHRRSRDIGEDRCRDEEGEENVERWHGVPRLLMRGLFRESF
ncbi:hypothetical protein D9M70_509530 [compost metagenome]